MYGSSQLQAPRRSESFHNYVTPPFKYTRSHFPHDDDDGRFDSGADKQLYTQVIPKSRRRQQRQSTEEDELMTMTRMRPRDLIVPRPSLEHTPPKSNLFYTNRDDQTESFTIGNESHLHHYIYPVVDDGLGVRVDDEPLNNNHHQEQHRRRNVTKVFLNSNDNIDGQSPLPPPPPDYSMDSTSRRRQELYSHFYGGDERRILRGSSSSPSLSSASSVELDYLRPGKQSSYNHHQREYQSTTLPPSNGNLKSKAMINKVVSSQTRQDYDSLSSSNIRRNTEQDLVNDSQSYYYVVGQPEGVETTIGYYDDGGHNEFDMKQRYQVNGNSSTVRTDNNNSYKFTNQKKYYNEPVGEHQKQPFSYEERLPSTQRTLSSPDLIKHTGNGKRFGGKVVHLPPEKEKPGVGRISISTSTNNINGLIPKTRTGSSSSADYSTRRKTTTMTNGTQTSIVQAPRTITTSVNPTATSKSTVTKVGMTNSFLHQQNRPIHNQQVLVNKKPPRPPPPASALPKEQVPKKTFMSTLIRRSKSSVSSSKKPEDKSSPAVPDEQSPKKKSGTIFSNLFTSSKNKKKAPPPVGYAGSTSSRSPIKITDSEIEEVERRRDQGVIYNSWSSADLYDAQGRPMPRRRCPLTFADQEIHASSGQRHEKVLNYVNGLSSPRQAPVDYNQHQQQKHHRSTMTLGRKNKQEEVRDDNSTLNIMSLDRRVLKKSAAPPKIVVTGTSEEKSTPMKRSFSSLLFRRDDSSKKKEQKKSSSNTLFRSESVKKEPKKSSSISSLFRSDSKKDKSNGTGGGGGWFSKKPKQKQSRGVRYFGDTDVDDENPGNGNYYSYDPGLYSTRNVNNGHNENGRPGGWVKTKSSSNGGRIFGASSNGSNHQRQPRQFEEESKSNKVYLHAATIVPEIPINRAPSSATSLERLSNLSAGTGGRGSSTIVEKKHLTRSVSMLSPLRPRHQQQHYRESVDAMRDENDGGRRQRRTTEPKSLKKLGGPGSSSGNSNFGVGGYRSSSTSNISPTSADKQRYNQSSYHHPQHRTTATNNLLRPPPPSGPKRRTP